MTRALVTGANGFVGSNLCRELLANGYTVRAMHRKGSDCSSIEGLDLERVEGDIRDRGALDSACDGQEVVFHIAALFRQAKFPDEVYREINVDGVQNVIDAAAAAGVQRMVHCSTVGVHSHIPDPPADESEAYRPGDIYQETKCEGEQLALRAFREGKIHGTVIRPAMIWGPGDTRTLKLFAGVAKGRFPYIGWGKTYLHWILVTDLARAFRLAAEADIPSGEVFIIAGERAVPLGELLELIAEAFGRKAPSIRIPAFPVQLMGSLCEAVCVPFGIEPPLYRRRVDFFTKTRSFSSQKARDLLRFEPELTLKGEVDRIASWYREHNWIPGAARGTLLEKAN